MRRKWSRKGWLCCRYCSNGECFPCLNASALQRRHCIDSLLPENPLEWQSVHRFGGHGTKEWTGDSGKDLQETFWRGSLGERQTLPEQRVERAAPWTCSGCGPWGPLGALEPAGWAETGEPQGARTPFPHPPALGAQPGAGYRTYTRQEMAQNCPRAVPASRWSELGSTMR